MKVAATGLALVALTLSSGRAEATLPERTRLKYEDFRPRCNLLTDRWITESEGIQLPKRKGAIVEYARGICRKLEADVRHAKGLSEEDAGLLSELALIEHSFVDRGRIQAGTGFLDIVKMGLSNDLSPWFLRFRKSDSPESADPRPSLYWNPIAPSEDLATRFDKLAAEKGVQEPGRYVTLEAFEGQGSTPKVHVLSVANHQRWSLKWGDEVHSDVVSSRLFASLGFDVDHPRYLGPGEVVLVLGKNKAKIRTAEELVSRIHQAYGVNLSPFILSAGPLGEDEARSVPGLEAYVGRPTLRFREAAMEPRPEKVTRLGGMGSEVDSVAASREVRGALLAHQWLGNWDTKEDNTLLSLLTAAPGKQRLLAEYSDLGLSLGVRLTKFPRDLKAGLVNELPWDCVKDLGDGKVQLLGRMNAVLKPFKEATYPDLRWMATKIALLDARVLRATLERSGWPRTVQELYFRKLAYRRAQILRVFAVSDPHPIAGLERDFSADIEPGLRIRKGSLELEPGALALAHPEGLDHAKGRFRGFGW